MPFCSQSVISSARRLARLCENSSPAGDPEKTTSPVSIWRVFFGGEGSENPFFVLPKCHFGVFAQPGQSALTSFPRKSAPTDVGGYGTTGRGLDYKTTGPRDYGTFG